MGLKVFGRLIRFWGDWAVIESVYKYVSTSRFYGLHALLDFVICTLTLALNSSSVQLHDQLAKQNHALLYHHSSGPCRPRCCPEPVSSPSDIRKRSQSIYISISASSVLSSVAGAASSVAASRASSALAAASSAAGVASSVLASVSSRASSASAATSSHASSTASAASSHSSSSASRAASGTTTGSATHSGSATRSSSPAQFTGAADVVAVGTLTNVVLGAVGLAAWMF